MPMHCDIQAAIIMAKNSFFYEHMKYIKIDCHYIRDKVMSGVISNPHVTSSYHLAGVFTKGLAGISCNATCTKLAMFDLYALA